MGFRFRKSIKIGPTRINLSKSGIGYSVGGKGFRVTKKARGGTRTTASIPGTGISFSSDSSRKKRSVNRTSKTQTTASKPNGCLAGSLLFIGICVCIGLIKAYWKILVALMFIAIAAYIAYEIYQNKKDSAEPKEPLNLITPAPGAEGTVKLEALPPAPELEAETNAATAPQVDASNLVSRSVHEQLAAATAQFDSELDAIPKVKIVPSTPAARQLLKNMPEYSFSNITRTTRLDSIFPLVALDVETTGLYPSKSEIIEVSAIKFETGMIPVSCFTSLCKPRKPIPEEATAVNNITDDMVKDAPSFAEVAPALTEFIHDCHVVGHNLDFDLRFIFAHGAKLPENKRFYDTLDLAHLTIPRSELTDYKLNSLCFYYGVWRDKAHRSLSDCYATSKIFAHLVHDKTSRQLVADKESESNPIT